MSTTSSNPMPSFVPIFKQLLDEVQAINGSATSTSSSVAPSSSESRAVTRQPLPDADAPQATSSTADSSSSTSSSSSSSSSAATTTRRPPSNGNENPGSGTTSSTTTSSTKSSSSSTRSSSLPPSSRTTRSTSSRTTSVSTRSSSSSPSPPPRPRTSTSATAGRGAQSTSSRERTTQTTSGGDDEATLSSPTASQQTVATESSLTSESVSEPLFRNAQTATTVPTTSDDLPNDAIATTSDETSAPTGFLQDDSDSGNSFLDNRGATAGVFTVVAILVLLALLGIVFLCRRHRRRLRVRRGESPTKGWLINKDMPRSEYATGSGHGSNPEVPIMRSISQVSTTMTLERPTTAITTPISSTRRLSILDHPLDPFSGSTSVAIPETAASVQNLYSIDRRLPPFPEVPSGRSSPSIYPPSTDDTEENLSSQFQSNSHSHSRSNSGSGSNSHAHPQYVLPDNRLERPGELVASQEGEDRDPRAPFEVPKAPHSPPPPRPARSTARRNTLGSVGTKQPSHEGPEYDQLQSSYSSESHSGSPLREYAQYPSPLNVSPISENLGAGHVWRSPSSSSSIPSQSMNDKNPFMTERELEENRLSSFEGLHSKPTLLSIKRYPSLPPTS